MQTEFDIATHGPGSYEITDHIASWLAPIESDGLLSLLIRHTSASLLIMENADPDVHVDLRAYFDRLVPPANDPQMGYLHHISEGPDDMPAHLKAALMPVSLSIPVQSGRMQLGTWQGIYVIEHRARPHQRRIAAHFRADNPT